MADKKITTKKAAPAKAVAKTPAQKKISISKKPKKKFYVPNSTGKRRMKSVKPRWRKPRGVDNKKRIRKAWFGACPKVGNKNPQDVRGLHPLGLHEILVNNVKELEGAEDVLVRIAGGVGKKKKADIVAKAKEMNLRVLNAGEGVKK